MRQDGQISKYWVSQKSFDLISSLRERNKPEGLGTHVIQ